MADSVEEVNKRKDEKMAEKALARERRRRLLPLFEELLGMGNQEFVELMLSAAEGKAGIRHEHSEDMSAWGNLDLTEPLEDVWSDFKRGFEARIESGINQYEKVADAFSDFEVHGERVESDFTYRDLEQLICAQIKQHPDDVDEDAAAEERRRNEEAAAQRKASKIEAVGQRKRKNDEEADTQSPEKNPRK